MAISLGRNQYGKAETHVVRVARDGQHHDLRDYTVTTALRGDFAAAHRDGDQANVLPTDTQKNTVFALARSLGPVAPEELGLALARHFVDTVPPVDQARVVVREAAWQRIMVDGRPHDHAFTRAGSECRTAVVTVAGRGPDQDTWVVSGVEDVVVLKSTGSEFRGFLRDRYTTLPEADDRVLATSLVARWRTGRAGDLEDGPPDAWDDRHERVREALLATFATQHSLALQQTLWHMGRAVLEREPSIAEIRLTAPNLHHFLVDLEPLGLDNPGTVYYAADRPYGLIETTVVRDEDADPGQAWPEESGR